MKCCCCRMVEINEGRGRGEGKTEPDRRTGKTEVMLGGRSICGCFSLVPGRSYQISFFFLCPRVSSLVK
jgi:hypothetical protein